MNSEFISAFFICFRKSNIKGYSFLIYATLESVKLMQKIGYHRLREKKSQKNNRDILEYLESFEIKSSSFLSGVGVKIRVDSIITIGFNVNFKIQSFEHTKNFEIIELYLNDSC